MAVHECLVLNWHHWVKLLQPTRIYLVLHPMVRNVQIKALFWVSFWIFLFSIAEDKSSFKSKNKKIKIKKGSSNSPSIYLIVHFDCKGCYSLLWEIGSKTGMAFWLNIWSQRWKWWTSAFCIRPRLWQSKFSSHFLMVFNH